MSLIVRKVAFGDTVHPNLHRTIKSCHANLMNLSVYPGTWYGEIPVGKYVRLSVILRLHAHEPEDEYYYTSALEDYITMIESCRLTYTAPKEISYLGIHNLHQKLQYLTRVGHPATSIWYETKDIREVITGIKDNGLDVVPVFSELYNRFVEIDAYTDVAQQLIDKLRVITDSLANADRYWSVEENAFAKQFEWMVDLTRSLTHDYLMVSIPVACGALPEIKKELAVDRGEHTVGKLLSNMDEVYALAFNANRLRLAIRDKVHGQ